MAEHAIERLSTCPACNGPAFSPLQTPGRWIGLQVFEPLRTRLGLVRCRSCSLVFTNPRPSDERLGAFYGGDFYSCHGADGDGSASATARTEATMERITPYLPPDAPRTLLDYGAGGGGFLRQMREQGWTVKGFEPGTRGRETCQSFGLDVTGDLATLHGEKFTLVTLHHVFEHLADPIAALDGIRPLLTSSGRVFIEVPNARSLRARLALPFASRRFAIDERYRAFPIHLMYYSDTTLREMLARAGWAVDSIFTLGMGLDEFFLHKHEPAAAAQIRKSSPGSNVSSTRPRKPRPFRRALRNAFLQRMLGENLGIIAHPS